MDLHKEIFLWFFGLNQSFLWINANGAISFQSMITGYTPSCAPVIGEFSMISPYWTGVDIRTTGNIYYRESRDSDVLQQSNMEIHNAFPEMDNINMNWAYIITWYNVTYYPDTDPYENKTRNFFQCVLATDDRFSYAIFYYNQMLWRTGDASGGHDGLGGTPAQAGFDAGDGIHRFMINGSCQDDLNTTLVTQSNVGKPGVWVFSVANSTIVAPSTRSTTNSTKKIVTTPTAPISALSNSDGTPCSCNKPTMWLDIIVAIDKSKSIGIGGLGSIGAQLATLFYGVNIAQGGSGYYSRVAIVLFSSDVKVLGDLKTYTSYNDLLKAFLNLETYHNATDIVVDIYAALDTAQNMFESQSDTSSRQARKVVLLYASSYNQIGLDDPKTIADQMINSNVFIVTVDYRDAGGATTKLLSQISTPFMNFSSADETNRANILNEIDQALCFANCVCPREMQQVITYNATSGRPMYWGDCIIPYDSGAFAQFAQDACTEIGGSLVSLTTKTKTDIVI
uniref:NIDO domain-containing protein n=1 Tax=Acrobeloides nanus TaxID=290746 RepID=A0A914CR66_9BILA